jgi:tRNA nucleotidyltransferase (CCA-adding enzyme)
VELLERLGRPPAVAALAGEEAVYVVGGAVRDLLLDRVPRELDFVVEGDAVAVARRAAARLGGGVLVHERFGTATVSAPGVVFDLAGARRERYERPGALPEVELGASLREDLARRDFTVNAIALHLSDGRLVAVAGALADLEWGVLRVLHERSFRDDPTRLLRLARYGARLGFEPEPETDALAAAAVADGAVHTVTGPRLGAELRLLLGEPQPAALLALERHGLGAAVVHAGFAVDPARVRGAIDLCPPDADQGLAALAACLVGGAAAAEAEEAAADAREVGRPAVPAEGPAADAREVGRPAVPAEGPAARAREVAAALDRLGFDSRDRDAVAAAAGRAPGLARALALRPGDAALWRLLRREGPETVALAGAFGAEDAARRWLDHVRHRRLAIDGHDIVAAGLSGPAVGAALEAATEAMLDGRAPGREEQLAAAVGTERRRDKDQRPGGS